MRRVFSAAAMLLVAPHAAGAQARMDAIRVPIERIARITDTTEVCGLALIRNRVLLCDAAAGRVTDTLGSAGDAQAVFHLPREKGRLERVSPWRGDSVAVVQRRALEAFIVGALGTGERPISLGAPPLDGKRELVEHRGTVLSGGFVFTAISQPTGIHEVQAWLAREGEIAETMRVVLARENRQVLLKADRTRGLFNVRVGQSSLVIAPPFAPQNLLAAGGRRIAVGVTSDPSIEIFDDHGRNVGVVRLSWPPAELKREQIRAANARFAEEGPPGLQPHRLRVLQLRAAPKVAPLYDQLFVDAFDRVWVRQTSVTGELATWWLFDQSLKPVRRVLIPVSVSLHAAASESELLGIDEAGRGVVRIRL